MGPPSQLQIATSSLTRLVKEEATYHTELSQQQASIAKLARGGGGGGGGGTGDENAEYQLRQERKAVEETKAIFPQLKQKIQDALHTLNQQLEQDKGAADQSTPEDITKANEAVAAAMAAIREAS